MRDYWLTQYIMAAVGWGYFIAALIAIALALWIPKGKRAKAIAVLIVVAVASILPLQGYQGYQKEKEAAELHRAKLAKALALFEERCKAAGEKIYRTVEGVEGVLLVNGRERSNKSAQFERNDPAGDDAHGAGYIESFLMGRLSDVQQTAKSTRGAYRFVEMVDPADQQRYRYSGKPTPRPSSPDVFDLRISKDVATGLAPRYGVVWEDISTPEDRDAWIAGSHIKVVDLRTNEIVGERIGYMMDQGQGSVAGGRAPWAYAAYTACPAFPKLHGQYPHKWALTRNFAERVIKPIQGE